MKNVRSFAMLLALGFLVGSLAMCSRDGDDTNNGGSGGGGGGTGEVKISSYNSNESHNAGQDCLSCHQAGKNEYVFQIAGTVYKKDKQTPAPGATVYLYDSLNGQGTQIMRIEVDKKGNFYTTQSPSKALSMLHPKVVGAQGSTHYMSSTLTSGSCNSCHNGTTTDRIWVDE